MADFINTIDDLGDDAVVDSLIEGTITEFKDDEITNIGAYALYNCDSLKTVDAPAVETIGNYSFYECGILESVSLPSIRTLPRGSMTYCPYLGTLNAPNVTRIDNETLQNSDTKSTGLATIVFPKVTYSGTWALAGSFTQKTVKFPALKDTNGGRIASYCKHLYLPVIERLTYYSLSSSYKLVGLVLSNTEKVCIADDSVLLSETPFNDPGYQAITKAPAYIYVPEALIEDYKVATNWTKYATKFRVLEDYTVDGTVTGDLMAKFPSVTYQMYNVTSSNVTASVGNKYTTTLTVADGKDLQTMAVTMGGIDVTEDVYDPETGVVSIFPVTGDIVIKAIAAGDGIITYSVIQGYPASANTNSTFTESTNGAVTVWFQAAPGMTIRVCMTEKTSTRFRIGFAKQPIANGVALYQPIAYDDSALETTFTVPDGYNYVTVYLGVTPYPNVEPGFLVETIVENTGDILPIYQGSISWNGANPGYEITENATTICTDYVPFTNNDHVSISMTNATYQVTLRGYDANKAYKTASGRWDTLPGNIAFDYPYVRFIIKTSTDDNISADAFDGATLTVGARSYLLTL